MDTTTPTGYSSSFAPRVKYILADPTTRLPKNYRLGVILGYSLFNLVLAGLIVGLLVFQHAYRHTQQQATYNAPQAITSTSQTTTVGKALTLKNSSAGVQAVVTVPSITQSIPTPADSYVTAGTHLASVEYQIYNNGNKTINDTIYNAVSVEESDGKTDLQSVGTVLPGCNSLSQFSLKPGQVLQGCVAFDVHNGSQIVSTKYWMQLGLGQGDTGTWSLASQP